MGKRRRQVRIQRGHPLRTRLRRAGLSGHKWTGDDSWRALKRIATALEDELVAQLRAMPEDECVVLVGGLLAAAFRDQMLWSEARGRGLPAGDPAGVVVGRQASRAVGVASLLLPLALRDTIGDQSSMRLTALDIAGLASQLLDCRMILDRSRHGLLRIDRVEFSDDGVQVQTSNPTGFDHDSWEKAAQARAGSDHEDPASEGLAEALVALAQAGGDPPPEMVDIDHALQSCRGYRLGDLLATLVNLHHLSELLPEDVPAWLGSAGALQEALVSMSDAATPHVESDALRGVVDELTFDAQGADGERQGPEQSREVGRRLATRPIVRWRDGQLLVARGHAGKAFITWGFALLEGTWPEDRDPQRDAALESALASRRGGTRPIREFEPLVHDQLAATGFLVFGPIAAGSRNALGISVRNEIDAVAVDKEHQMIWVVEAKDEALALTARRVRNEIDGYYRSTRSGHQAKLQRKCEDVAASIDTVLQRAGESHTSGWTVAGVFVTRNPSPAEFDERRLFRFTDVASVGDVLTSGGH
jgi:hypothetical protein